MIYADENVWLPVANGLQRRGWEVTTALEADMLGVGDFEHLQYATERDWPLLTFDDDFLSIAESGSTVENPREYRLHSTVRQERRRNGQVRRRDAPATSRTRFGERGRLRVDQ